MGISVEEKGRDPCLCFGSDWCGDGHMVPVSPIPVNITICTRIGGKGSPASTRCALALKIDSLPVRESFRPSPGLTGDGSGRKQGWPVPS